MYGGKEVSPKPQSNGNSRGKKTKGQRHNENGLGDPEMPNWLIRQNVMEKRD